MATFGANLRREREMRGVPLEEIAAATKISVRSLQALEAEEFAKLPGGIFTRSFIRAYAKYLGLDEETVIGEYQAVAPASEDADLSRLSPSKPRPPTGKSRTPIWGLLFALVLLAGGFAIFRYSHRVVESQGTGLSHLSAAPPTGTTQTQPVTTTASTGTGGQAGPAAGTEGGADAGQGATTPGAADPSKIAHAAAATTLAAANGAGADTGLTLQVAATEQAWVAVEADGKTAMNRILKPNDIQTFKARDSFDVFTGNAEGVILTLNGETLKPLGRRKEDKKVHLTHDDLKNLNP
jgi:cytoskeleton protein RodZ